MVKRLAAAACWWLLSSWQLQTYHDESGACLVLLSSQSLFGRRLYCTCCSVMSCLWQVWSDSMNYQRLLSVLDSSKKWWDTSCLIFKRKQDSMCFSIAPECCLLESLLFEYFHGFLVFHELCYHLLLLSILKAFNHQYYSSWNTAHEFCNCFEIKCFYSRD